MAAERLNTSEGGRGVSSLFRRKTLASAHPFHNERAEENVPSPWKTPYTETELLYTACALLKLRIEIGQEAPRGTLPLMQKRVRLNSAVLFVDLITKKVAHNPDLSYFSPHTVGYVPINGIRERASFKRIDGGVEFTRKLSHDARGAILRSDVTHSCIVLAKSTLRNRDTIGHSALESFLTLRARRRDLPAQNRRYRFPPTGAPHLATCRLRQQRKSRVPCQRRGARLLAFGHSRDRMQHGSHEASRPSRSFSMAVGT